MGSPTPLELLPVAGLANRLRAMASAVCAAEELGRPLVIAWTQQYSICRGRAATLFDLSATPLQIRDDGFGGPPPYRHKECLSPSDWERSSRTSPEVPLYLKSYGVFWQKEKARWLTALRSIRPHPRIQEAATHLFALLPPTTPLVGVHIRRTDNRKSIAESPTNSFVTAMASYPPTTHFFLATDDTQERQTLLQTFPGRIHFGATNLNRDSEEGGIHALLDFVCLSRCSEILGSAGSSFSEIAAAYGGIPLRVVRSDDQPRPPTPNA